MYFDPLYIVFALPGLLIGLWAQAKLSMAYEKYRRVGLSASLSGAEAAREVLDRAGLVNVPVGEVPGKLTDHYDPTKRHCSFHRKTFIAAQWQPWALPRMKRGTHCNIKWATAR